MRALNEHSRISSPLGLLFILGGCSGILGGCSGTPSAVEVPTIDPLQAAKAALEQYDKNGDGQLTSEELESCPALHGALGSYDANNDRAISEEELVDRFAMWVASGIGVSSLICQVEMDGRPLPGAEVRLVPEEFLSEWVQVATGTADKSGVAMLAIDSKYLPDDMKNFRGVHQGLFKIEITHPSMVIPTKYSIETILGKEVSFETGENYFIVSVSRN